MSKRNVADAAKALSKDKSTATQTGGTISIFNLTSVPIDSFKTAVEVLVKLEMLDGFVDLLRSQGYKDLYFTESAYLEAVNYVKDHYPENIELDTALKDKLNAVIQCAGCCNGCSV